MEKTCESVWKKCLQIIKDNVNAQSFKTWFEPIKPVKLDGKVLTIEVPSQFFYEWLEEHYVELIAKTIKRIDFEFWLSPLGKKIKYFKDN